MKYVAYYRVSTQKQGQSGLGLAAQKEAVRKFTENCPDCVIAEFTEVETGTRKRKRVEIYKAIELAKKEGATLIIAKLDRLARNVHFVTALQEQGVKFVACDMPDASELTIHIMASLAQWEANRISDRTREALAAKKRTGWKAGTPENLTDADRRKGARAMKAKAATNENNRRALDAIRDKAAAGKSLATIAAELNAAGYQTARGKAFQKTTVSRLLARA